MQNEIRFSFEKTSSSIFTSVFRPIAQIHFRARQSNFWVPVWGIVDTGADYILLPKGYAQKLEINLSRDCRIYKTLGIGGQERSCIYLNAKIRIGSFERTAPIGFLERNDIPPLFGRQGFLETFELIFKNHETIFRENQARMETEKK